MTSMQQNENVKHDMPRHGRIQIRVRYTECDPMSVAHHAAYPVWFEIGRTELYRDAGFSYRDFEANGAHLAVVALEVRYKAAVHYDDVLTLETTLAHAGRVKLQHTYQLLREGKLVATGSTTLACVDTNGKLQPMPEFLVHDH
jgi:acyl-CoA thioester hydrolase